MLHPLHVVSVASDQRAERVGSSAEHGKAMVVVLDELFTRPWGCRAIIASRQNAQTTGNSTRPISDPVSYTHLDVYKRQSNPLTPQVVSFGLFL